MPSKPSPEDIARYSVLIRKNLQANYRGMFRYGFMDDARELAERTICLFGRDIERFCAPHEYYQPENGEPILNRGFQNWNYLVPNMIAWLEGKPVISEF